MTTDTLTIRMTLPQKRALRMAAAAADKNMTDFVMEKLYPYMAPYLPAKNDPQTDQNHPSADRSDNTSTPPNRTTEAVALVY